MKERDILNGAIEIEIDRYIARERERERDYIFHSETQPRLEPGTCQYIHICLF